MSKATKQRIAMKALIIRDGKVLSLQEATDSYSEGTQGGKWGFAGGRLDVGEHWQDGLLREVKEETGLENIEVIRPLCVDEWTPTIKGEPTQIVAVFFVCKSDTGDVKLSEEHSSYKWVGPEEMDDINMMPEDKVAVERYFKEEKE